MKTEIHRIQLGICNCYLVKEAGVVLIDGGGPGHSPGSMSVLLASGDAFVGDLAANGFPLRICPGMPAFVEDSNAVKQSWRLLLRSGCGG